MSADSILLPDEFTQAAAQRLAAEPEVEVLSVDDLALFLRVGGREVTSELDNFYAMYRSAPDQLPAIWEMLADLLTENVPDRSESDTAVLLERVMPMLKPLALLNEVRAEGLPLLVYRPLVGDLMVTYVVDEGESVAYLNEGHLQRWGVSEDVLWARSLANLRARTRGVRPQRIGSGAGSLLLLNGGDGYDAARLLLPEIFATFAATVPGNLVIGVPSRDFLLAFSDRDRRIFEQIKTQIETDARVQAHPLTEQLFTYQNGALARYADR
jgi:uncharacterized protein YtpQ (UPF0354 family)